MARRWWRRELMNEHTGKLAVGLLALVGVWILVYWLVPAAPRVTFAEQALEPLSEVAESAPPEDPNVADVRVTTGNRLKAVPGAAGPAAIGASAVPARESGKPAAESAARRGGVIAPQFVDHTVEAGETFGTIAAKYYGKSGMGSVVARANPFVDPTRLRPGRILKVPKDPANIQGIEVLPEVPGERVVVVQSGDTLSSLAKAHFGTVTMADAIFEANRDTLQSADDLAVGQRLRLPPRDVP